jgi:hypothetical protein
MLSLVKSKCYFVLVVYCLVSICGQNYFLCLYNMRFWLESIFVCDLSVAMLCTYANVIDPPCTQIDWKNLGVGNCNTV